ncbi:hypothetical protein GUJ93_ZPchr0010g9292 [Zizania palustris]|uniref:Uncharacterized protein n=1 Tax=Zizania palustris TaxID=103762 RepID=A0A8J6BI82_ZIZPA|nr:hypothetical protein GUJ93_ZPchr0010g9292 [Zizania palustris]
MRSSGRWADLTPYAEFSPPRRAQAVVPTSSRCAELSPQATARGRLSGVRSDERCEVGGAARAQRGGLSSAQGHEVGAPARARRWGVRSVNRSELGTGA